MRVVKVVNETSGAVIADHVEVADTSLTRFVGLLGRRGLDAGAGLWIKPCSGVHMLGMLFKIDVIGLDKDRRVIKVWERLMPFAITSVSMKMRSAVELPAGQISASGVKIGDLLSFS
ncbi:MAG: DUF192 domain-containing protein [Acidobacteriota bacterium]